MGLKDPSSSRKYIPPRIAPMHYGKSLDFVAVDFGYLTLGFRCRDFREVNTHPKPCPVHTQTET